MSCCNSDSDHAYAAGSGKLDAPRRNRYYFSKMMDVLQFEMEQSYGNSKRWLLNRLSLGTGVLCGLNVKVDGKYLCVTPGVAIDTFGHEVIVPGRYCLDPWLLPDECGRPTRELSRNEAHRVTLCLGYRECLADQAPVLVTDCRSEQLCEAGSVVESFNLWVHEDWPKSGPGLCEALNDATATAGYQVVATVDVGGRPLGVAVAANGKRALVINEAAAVPTLQVLDLTSNTVVHTFSGLAKAPLGGVSIAPDGGAIFVTHADGVVVVNLDTVTPKAEVLLADIAYGACAASHAGTRLYAINTTKKLVEQIDVATRTVTPVKPAKRPTDLAVSSDSSVLFVVDADSKTLFAIDTAANTLRYTESTDRPTRSLAATGKAGAIDAWSAHDAGGARRFNDTGIVGDVIFTANAGDSAFTSDGARYYVTHTASDSAGEVVVLARTDAKEIARLPVGKAPVGIAIVPGRLRGLIANADSGTVTVIDVASLRQRLCKALLGPCPEPEDKPCIELATVELLPDGSIGKVDVCTHRVRLLSNETLLELILCLADRLDTCCGGHVPPQEPPPPVVNLLKVTGVEFFDLRGKRIALQHPEQITTFKAADNFNRIRLTFDRPVDLSTITTGPIALDPKTFSLLVTSSWSTAPLNAVAGTAVLASPNAVDYTIGPEPRTFIGGDYKLVLFGNVDPSGTRPVAKATDGSVLDGEPSGFPSGNGTPGGNFTIKFISVPQ
ncbi:MAG: YncE family protein [Rhodanobacteraceae bacterium]|nr:YncE family protein [Rhodanobacteraceae bacterium]